MSKVPKIEQKLEKTEQDPHADFHTSVEDAHAQGLEPWSDALAPQPAQVMEPPSNEQRSQAEPPTPHQPQQIVKQDKHGNVELDEEGNPVEEPADEVSTLRDARALPVVEDDEKGYRPVKKGAVQAFKNEQGETMLVVHNSKRGFAARAAKKAKR